MSNKDKNESENKKNGTEPDNKFSITGMLTDRKNRKKLIILGTILLLSIIALMTTSKHPSHSEQTRTETSAGRTDGWNDDEWERMEDKSRIISDSLPTEEEAVDSNPTDTAGTKNDSILVGLSQYPSPSFVSEAGDSLVYRGAIYKRTGFVEAAPSMNDTINVDGIRYVRIGD